MIIYIILFPIFLHFVALKYIYFLYIVNTIIKKPYNSQFSRLKYILSLQPEKCTFCPLFAYLCGFFLVVSSLIVSGCKVINKKRTYNIYNGLIFSELRGFIGGGGYFCAQNRCGAHNPFLKKRNF